jgi:hypothetical protein
MTVKNHVYQPLRSWPYGVPEPLMPEISVTSAPDLLKEEDSSVRWIFSGSEIHRLKTCKAWLCCEFEDELPMTIGVPRQDRAIQSVKNSQLAIQIVAPVGLQEAVTLVAREGPDGIHLGPLEQEPPMLSTTWARTSRFDGSSLTELSNVLRGVHGAFHSEVTRLVNPMHFLELGMQSNHRYLRPFLWITGLDALLMANNTSVFASRLNNFLGPNSFVFQRFNGSEQPRYRVEDMAEDLYDFRNIVAHGRSMPKRFREAVGFIDTDGQQILGYDQNHRYSQILEESALLLLARALRKIFTEDLADTFGKEKSWRDYLKTPHP